MSQVIYDLRHLDKEIRNYGAMKRLERELVGKIYRINRIFDQDEYTVVDFEIKMD